MGPEGRRRGSKPPIHALSIYLSYTFFPLPLFHRFLSVLPWNPSPFHFLPLLTIVTIFLSFFLYSMILSLSFSLFLPFLHFLSYFLYFLYLPYLSPSLLLPSFFYLRTHFIILTTSIFSFSLTFLSFFFIQRRSMRAVKKDSFTRLVGFWRKPMMVQRGLRRH